MTLGNACGFGQHQPGRYDARRRGFHEQVLARCHRHRGGVFLLYRPAKIPGELVTEFSHGASGSQVMVGGRCLQERCLTIVVAPWCPACRRMKGTISALRQQVEADGRPVFLVIGMDKPEALQNYARQHSETVLLDMNRSFTKRANIRSVPYFAVTNHKGEIVEEMKGGYDDVREMRRRLGV
ncbi:TlpA family protein disulfide reductase [Acidovorax sp.]|uniref:TlpA family protein disulfide reductase n=1 Tax=Acidovorax sp. TaxID=1872122 RepID=UPI00391EFFAC